MGLYQNLPTKKRNAGMVLTGLVLYCLLAPLCSATELRTIGRFQPRPALTLYLINDGGSAAIELGLFQGARAEGDRVMIRLLDPEEKTVYRQYVEPGRMRESLQPGGGEVYGIPIKIPAVSKSGDLLLQTKLRLTRSGIWQLRITAGARNSIAEIALPEGVSYGVSFQNGDFTTWNPDLGRAHVYVPPHAETLHLGGGPVRVTDGDGDVRLDSDKMRASASAIQIDDVEELWTFDFPKPEKWRLRAWGMPVIFCPSAATARKLRASVEVCSDGSVVSHKFQVRIHQLMPDILAPERVGNTEDLVADLERARTELLANPARHELLMQGFDGLMVSINPLLRSQNLDPQSHWAGVLDGWQAFVDKDPPANRWDRLTAVPGLWGGVSPTATAAGAEKLALAATADLPGGLWSGREALLWRAAAACLKDLMALGESEVFYGGSARDPYPGFMGFILAQKTFPAYEVAAPRLPAEVRDVWTDGLARIVDRTYPDGLVSARNQSSHYLVAYNAFAEGSGLEAYEKLADAYVQRWVRGQSDAGYFVESMGPCSSYIGMTNWHMAAAYRSRPDPDLLASIRRSYRFFNHTVAPEPDGHMLGACNMNHRVGNSFVREQWQGARGIVDDLVPEVAAWRFAEKQRRDGARAVKVINDAIERGGDYLNPTYGPGRYNMNWPRWKWWSPDAETVPWPATESEPFIRSFGDELIAVRRPGYYLAVYVGTPAPVPHYVRGRERFRTPFPEGDDSSGGDINARRITPFQGGGLSLFWTRDYGSSVLATSWTPLAHHGLVAWRPDDTRWWEEYFAVDHQLDKRAGTLTVTGHLEKMPLAYTRTYTFGDDALRVDLRLRATKDVRLQRLVENIPYARGGAKPRSPSVTADDTESGNVKAETVAVRDEKGAGIDIVLDGERMLHLEPNGRRNGDLQIGRVEVSLPSVWQSGDTHHLSYRLIPVGAE